MVLRRHWLPDGEDTPEDIAAAVWLDNRYFRKHEYCRQ
ncbi:DUF6890 family protein [Shigella boydii]